MWKEIANLSESPEESTVFVYRAFVFAGVELGELLLG